ncbi:glutamate racemase [bacterium]|jgi:glutamate racemase|nr:glutamate racemase [bacterium]MBT4649168.1 glutamate racemase [bacterium]
MIGIFDSGFGGLAVFREIVRALPKYDYIYLGDNARAPYGDLSQDVIYQYTQQAVDYLFTHDCNLIILACNTVSAEALRKLQQEYLPFKYPGKNVLGIIRPLSEIAASTSKNKNIAVLGTQSTINSNAYQVELQEQDKNIQVIQQACPLLVSLVEDSQEKTESSQSVLHNYLAPLVGENFDTLILGCTHYSFFHDQIENFFKKRVKIIENGQSIAKKLTDYIKRHPAFGSRSASSLRPSGEVAQARGEFSTMPTGRQENAESKQRVFLTTGDSKKFDQAAKKFLGQTIISQKIKL